MLLKAVTKTCFAIILTFSKKTKSRLSRILKSRNGVLSPQSSSKSKIALESY